MFISRDTAKTWTSLTDGLPSLSITALAIDDSLLYSGTEGSSVFVLNINGISIAVTPYNDAGKIRARVPTLTGLSQEKAYILNYSLAASGNVQITLYDISGHTIKTLLQKWQSSGDHKLTFSISSLANGKYVLRIKGGEKDLSVPFCKTK